MRLGWIVAGAVVASIATCQGALAQDDFAPFLGTWATDCSSAERLTIVAGGGAPRAAFAVDGKLATGPVEGFGEEKGIVAKEGDTERLFYVTVADGTLNLSYFSGRDRRPEVTVAGARLEAGGSAVPLTRCEEAAATTPGEGPVVKVGESTVRVLTPDELIGSWGPSPDYARGRPFFFACPGWERKEGIEAKRMGLPLEATSAAGTKIVGIGTYTFFREDGGISMIRRDAAGGYRIASQKVSNIRQDNPNQLRFRFNNIDHVLKRTKFLKWNWNAKGEKVETLNLSVVESPFFIYEFTYKRPDSLNTDHESLLKCLP